MILLSTELNSEIFAIKKPLNGIWVWRERDGTDWMHSTEGRESTSVIGAGFSFKIVLVYREQ
jgi:hypothetical protein